MRDFTGLLIKYAGPSPRDRAVAGVPGAAAKLQAPKRTPGHRNEEFHY